MRSWNLSSATDYHPNWGTLNFKNSCLHPYSEIGYYEDSAWEPQKSFTTVLCLEVLQHLTNFYLSFTDCILPCWTLKMGYSYVPPLRPLFHALFPKTAISEYFSSSRSYIRLKSQISGKFAFQSLKIEEKFNSYA